MGQRRAAAIFRRTAVLDVGAEQLTVEHEAGIAEFEARKAVVAAHRVDVGVDPGRVLDEGFGQDDAAEDAGNAGLQGEMVGQGIFHRSIAAGAGVALVAAVGAGEDLMVDTATEGERQLVRRVETGLREGTDIVGFLTGRISRVVEIRGLAIDVHTGVHRSHLEMEFVGEGGVEALGLGLVAGLVAAGHAAEQDVFLGFQIGRAVGERHLRVEPAGGLRVLVGEDDILAVEIVDARIGNRTAADDRADIGAIGAHAVVGHALVAELEAIARQAFIGHLAETADEAGAGAGHGAAVAILVVVAVDAVQEAEHLEAVGAGIAGAERAEGVAIGLEAALDIAAPVASVAQQVVDIDGLVGDRAGQGARTGVGGGNAGIDAGRLQEPRIDDVGDVVVEQLVVLARPVDRHGEIGLLDAVDIDLLVGRDGAADRHRGLAAEEVLHRLRAEGLDLGVVDDGDGVAVLDGFLAAAGTGHDNFAEHDRSGLTGGGGGLRIIASRRLRESRAGREDTDDGTYRQEKHAAQRGRRPVVGHRSFSFTRTMETRARHRGGQVACEKMRYET